MAAENGDFMTLRVKVSRQNAAHLPAASGKHDPQPMGAGHLNQSIIDSKMMMNRHSGIVTTHQIRRDRPVPFPKAVPINASAQR